MDDRQKFRIGDRLICPKCKQDNDLQAEYCWKCYYDFVPTKNKTENLNSKVGIVSFSGEQNQSMIFQKIFKYSSPVILILSIGLSSYVSLNGGRDQCELDSSYKLWLPIGLAAGILYLCTIKFDESEVPSGRSPLGMKLLMAFFLLIGTTS